MGAEKFLLERLFEVFVALEQNDQKTLATLRASAKPTPSQLDPHFTPNQKLLQAAVSYVDALLLQAPNTDPKQAGVLANQVLTIQLTLGHGVVAPPGTVFPVTKVGPIETLTSSHAQLWHAGAASLLAAALRAADQGLTPLCQRWWRAEAALCHLTAWNTTWTMGHYKVIAPGARGGSKSPSKPGAGPAAENSARDLDYELLLTGQLPVPATKIQDRYFLGPWLLGGLSSAQLAPLRSPGTGAPLQGPNGASGPWTVKDVPLLPSTLFLRRAGNQHSAWFEALIALDPQFQAGVNADGAWFDFFDDASPPRVNGGSSPFAAPVQPDAPVQQYGSTAPSP
jgi:hypothetical protein